VAVQITAFTVPAAATAGVPFPATVTAAGGASRTITLTATATDLAGGTATQDAQVVVTDPVTIRLTTNDPNTVITPGAQPGEFTVVAN